MAIHMRGDLRVVFDGLDAKVCVEAHSDNQSMVFTRTRGRWRCGGPYCSLKTIVLDWFAIPPGELTENCLVFEDVVSQVGKVIDSALEFLSEQTQRRLEAERKQRIAMASSFSDWQDRQEIERNDNYLYLIRHVTGLTKIGVSKYPKARERTLQAEDPRLELIWTCKAGYAEERRLHEIFSELRVRGEWFRLDDRHIEWIKACVGRSQQNH